MCIFDLIEFLGHHAEFFIAIFTLVLATVTYRLVTETRKMATDAKEAAAKQLRVASWLEFSKRYDSPDMLRARVRLAKARREHRDEPLEYGKASEVLLNFFEDLAIIYQQDSIDRELADNSFRYAVRRWWMAIRVYIDDEQERNRARHTLYDKFQWLAGQFEKGKVPLNNADLENFLKDESNLCE